MASKNLTRSKFLHESFELGILLKGIDGILEILGCFLLLYITPARLDKLVAILTQHELSKDPRDFIANYLIKLASGFSISSQHFGALYLLSHGLIKVLLVYLLWKGKSWSYPLAIAFLILFICYQVYRFTFTHSIFLVILTVFDLVMIYLTYVEYKRVRAIAA